LLRVEWEAIREYEIQMTDALYPFQDVDEERAFAIVPKPAMICHVWD
jgi:hypothetical protein